MRSNFETALKYVLVDEGGNDDDPRDHGGRTSRGITQREYDSWCRLNGKPTGDVWAASDKEIRDVYFNQYWEPYCSDFPSGLDYLFFDISVNAGRTQAVRTFQKALKVKVDGMMGQVTQSAIIHASDIPQLIKDIGEVRRRFYRSLKQFPIYGRGWLSRVDHAEHGALLMTQEVVEYRQTPAVAPKADETDIAKPTVSPETSGASTIASGGLLSILDSFKATLANYQNELVYVKYALIVVAVVSLGYAIWGYYKRSKNQAGV